MDGNAVTVLLALIVSTGFAQPRTAQHIVSVPTGEYYYEQSNGAADEHYLFFRQSGFTVIGVEMRSQRQLCFRGIIKDDRITNMTRIFPPYNPASRIEVSKEGINLDRYQASQRRITDSDRKTLLDCIHLFWR